MIDESVTIWESINIQLNRIADALEVLARPGADYSPNYVKPIEDYRNFNWASINASIVRSDQDGPTHVQWNGQVFTRRSPVNKFEPAIWYSRATGKDEEGGTEYTKLITFRTIKDADPLPEKARVIVGSKPSQVNGNGKTYAAQTVPPASATKKEPLPLVSFTDYLKHATRLTLSEPAANNIAKLAGVEDRSGDYSIPDSYLEFFRDCKQAGMMLSDGWTLLTKHDRDTKKATSKLPNF